jgi:hypothetical protein
MTDVPGQSYTYSKDGHERPTATEQAAPAVMASLAGHEAGVADGGHEGTSCSQFHTPVLQKHCTGKLG